jgi:creatinine amidohydrolase
MSMTWLARVHPETAWAHLATTDFASAAARPGAIAILPVHGLADHGLGLPLDAEETVGSTLLAEAVGEAAGACAPCVLPPLRFGCLGEPRSTWFNLPAEDARDLVLELARGVAFAGFSKLLVFSTSPWQREWLDAAARDVRVETGLVVYRIHLGSLGLDFHPAASETVRLSVQALAADLLQTDPVASAARLSSDESFRPGRWVHAPPLPAGPVPAERLAAARQTRRQTAERLARLIVEAAWHGRGEAPRAAPPPQPPAIGPLWRPFGERYLGALIPERLSAAAARADALAIVPTGAIEQHGPHLPVGVDAQLGQGLLARALARLDDAAPVWVAPPVLAGKSNEHADWPGTLTLSHRVFSAVVRAQVAELRRLGFRRIAFFNTHGGNSAVLVPLIREFHAAFPEIRVGMLQSAYKPAQSPQEAAYGFHAGEWETSLMLALAPPLVRRARAVRHYPAQLDDAGELRPEGAALNLAWTTRDIAPQGVIGDATLATPSQGEHWVEHTAASLAEKILELTRR